MPEKCDLDANARRSSNDSVTGFIVDGVDAMADAIARTGEIDRAACCRAAEERFDVRTMTDRYLALYAARACND